MYWIQIFDIQPKPDVAKTGTR